VTRVGTSSEFCLRCNWRRRWMLEVPLLLVVVDSMLEMQEIESGVSNVVGPSISEYLVWSGTVLP